MATVTLFGSAPSPFVRTVRMALEEKGVDYELTRADLKDPEYRAFHPFAKMPALEHGEHRVFETLGICSYVDSAFEGPALLPDTALARAVALQWVSASNDYLFGTIIARFLLERFAPQFFERPSDEAIIAKALPEVEQQLSILNQALGGKLFFAGRQLSLADLFIAPIIAYVVQQPEGSASLANKPDLARWFQSMKNRPSFAATEPTF